MLQFQGKVGKIKKRKNKAVKPYSIVKGIS